jgi:trehalose-6-phosphate synthase
MRFFLRLLGALWLATFVVSAGFAWYERHSERTKQIEDLHRRAALAADAVREASERLVARGARTGYEKVLNRFGRQDRAIAIFDAFGSVIEASAEVRRSIGPISPLVTEAIQRNQATRAFATVNGRTRFVHVVPLQQDDGPIGAAAVLLDAEYLDTAEWDLWQRTAVRIGVLTLLLTGITWLVVRWSVTRPMARIAEWTRQLKSGKPVTLPPQADVSLFGPLATEVTGLARTLARARLAAAEEARLRLAGESLWTEERLKQFVEIRFGERPMYVVSNREPVSHVYDGRGGIAEVRPASGLVTALEPIMLACGGVWVAHGSGSADRVAGERIGLPTPDPAYSLRRVWLSEQEETGYYYGFANEGLWPLCHIVHERPQFRADDWEQYRSVNGRFAATLLEEMEKTEHPIVLAQDYHFALLPQLVKQNRPDARVALFWHIPWPNFEAFGICPWQDEILLGLLGADLIGFHTQFHCNNFLETVERTIEGRVDWENFTVVRGQHRTWVRPFPISVAPDDAEPLPPRAALRAELGIGTEWLGVGVERVDYTKGLPERIRALRRFFERWPEFRRRLTFVQIASLSRSRIPRYRALQEEVREAVRSINEELGERGWLPIIYRERHHDHTEIRRYYRAADFCMVTSLHDGMNLVAKEYVAAQDDDEGSLILSRFTGASRELRDAWMVNPYDVEDMAAAIHDAVTADPEERRSRMSRLRSHVREYNIYGWAGMLAAELSRISQPSLQRG